MGHVKLVLEPGHPHGKMCVLLANGQDVDVTAEGVVVDEDQVTDDIRLMEKWISIVDAESDNDVAAQRAHLEAMNMSQLREVAKPLGVSVKDTKKAELIDEILAASK